MSARLPSGLIVSVTQLPASLLVHVYAPPGQLIESEVVMLGTTRPEQPPRPAMTELRVGQVITLENGSRMVIIGFCGDAVRCWPLKEGES